MVKQASVWDICEAILNTLNHVFIGATSIYLTYFCFVTKKYQLFNVTTDLHVLLSTLGYQLLMAESILVFTSQNSWTQLLKRPVKNCIHWVLQLVGSLFALYGVGVILYLKDWKFNWQRNHTIFGLLASFALIANLFLGISALYSANFRHLIQPVFIKFLHNLLGLVTFTFGMVSLYYGFGTRYMKRSLSSEAISLLMGLTLLTLALTCVGPLKSLVHQSTQIARKIPGLGPVERKKEKSGDILA